MAPDPTDKQLDYATATLREAMANLRHNQTLSFRVAVWGSTSLAAFAAWILQQDGFQSLQEKLLISAIVFGFVISLLIVQANCKHQSAQAQRAVIRLDKAFGFFEKGQYIDKEQLFPTEWSKLKKRSFLRRIAIPVAAPLVVACVVVLLVVLVR